jgi:hypothetical protein
MIFTATGEPRQVAAALVMRQHTCCYCSSNVCKQLTCQLPNQKPPARPKYNSKCRATHQVMQLSNPCFAQTLALSCPQEVATTLLLLQPPT